MPKILCVLLTLLLMSSARANAESSLISAMPDNFEMFIRVDLSYLRQDRKYDVLADQVIAETQSKVALYLGDSTNEFLSKSTVIEYSEYYRISIEQPKLSTFAFHNAMEHSEFDQYVSKNGLARFGEHAGVPIYYGKVGQVEESETFFSFYKIDNYTVFMVSPTLANTRLMIETVIGKQPSFIINKYGDKLDGNNQDEMWFLYYYDLPRIPSHQIVLRQFYAISNDFYQVFLSIASEAYSSRDLRENLSTMQEIEVFCQKIDDHDQLEIKFSFPNEEVAQAVFDSLVYARGKIINHYRFRPQNQNNTDNLNLIDIFDQTESDLDQNKINLQLNIKNNFFVSMYDRKETIYKKIEIEEKLSRTKSDMKSLEMAILSYYVDNNVYPASTQNPEMAFKGTSGLVTSVSGKPISWFMVRPNEESQLMSITTPISYISSYPTDPFMDDETWSSYVYHSTVRDWMLQSTGPDQDYDISFKESGTDRSEWKNSLILKTYDPSNGLISNGDIWRIRN